MCILNNAISSFVSVIIWWNQQNILYLSVTQLMHRFIDKTKEKKSNMSFQHKYPYIYAHIKVSTSSTIAPFAKHVCEAHE